MEVARYFINLDLAFYLTSFIFIELFLCCPKYDIRRALLSHLLESVGDAFNLSILVELVLMKSTLNVDFVYTSDINHVQGQDRTWCFWQCEIDIEQELKEEALA